MGDLPTNGPHFIMDKWQKWLGGKSLIRFISLPMGAASNCPWPVHLLDCCLSIWQSMWLWLGFIWLIHLFNVSVCFWWFELYFTSRVTFINKDNITVLFFIFYYYKSHNKEIWQSEYTGDEGLRGTCASGRLNFGPRALNVRVIPLELSFKLDWFNASSLAGTILLLLF